MAFKAALLKYPVPNTTVPPQAPDGPRGEDAAAAPEIWSPVTPTEEPKPTGVSAAAAAAPDVAAAPADAAAPAVAAVPADAAAPAAGAACCRTSFSFAAADLVMRSV